jgi:hypothetical protein
MLASCQPDEITLPYETLVQISNVVIVDEMGNPHDARYKKVNFFIVNNPGEAQHIADKLADRYYKNNQHHFTEISDVDYVKYFVIVAHAGDIKGLGGSITIDKIIQSGSTIYVVTSTVIPDTAYHSFPNPVHAVQVKRSDLITTGELTFTLINIGEYVLTKIYTIESVYSYLTINSSTAKPILTMEPYIPPPVDTRIPVSPTPYSRPIYEEPTRIPSPTHTEGPYIPPPRDTSVPVLPTPYPPPNWVQPTRRPKPTYTEEPFLHPNKDISDPYSTYPDRRHGERVEAEASSLSLVNGIC